MFVTGTTKADSGLSRDVHSQTGQPNTSRHEKLQFKLACYLVDPEKLHPSRPHVFLPL